MTLLKIFKKGQKKANSEKKLNSESKPPEYVVTLNKKNFDQFIKKYSLTIIDFWAPWCAPCKTMSPRLRRLSKIYCGKVAFGKLNTQEFNHIAQKYKVTGIPHFAFFSYGKKISSATGVKSVGNLKELINEILEEIN